MATPEVPKGSKRHADYVMTTASHLLEPLHESNTFKPHVLAKVSCNDAWYVGSSISVSPFLRPLCLYRRIVKFKCCFKKAVINYKPLHTAGNQNWSSSAFYKKNYTREKPPCKNCRMMFENLKGFISCNDDAVQGGDTFLAACAEYCPVDRLLVDDMGEMTEYEKAKLKKNWEQSVVLFENYGRVVDDFVDAYYSNDEKQQLEVFRQEKSILHIFGTKPKYNEKF